MFPPRPSRVATALLELAEAMLAPEASERPAEDALLAGLDRSGDAGRTSRTHAHPHRRTATVDRSRRPTPPRPEQACLAPVTRAARAREALRS
jgi:hypothetical protein